MNVDKTSRDIIDINTSMNSIIEKISNIVINADNITSKELIDLKESLVQLRSVDKTLSFSLNPNTLKTAEKAFEKIEIETNSSAKNENEIVAPEETEKQVVDLVSIKSDPDKYNKEINASLDKTIKVVENLIEIASKQEKSSIVLTSKEKTESKRVLGLILTSLFGNKLKSAEGLVFPSKTDRQQSEVELNVDISTKNNLSLERLPTEEDKQNLDVELETIPTSKSNQELPVQSAPETKRIYRVGEFPNYENKNNENTNISDNVAAIPKQSLDLTSALKTTKDITNLQDVPEKTNKDVQIVEQSITNDNKLTQINNNVAQTEKNLTEVDEDSPLVNKEYKSINNLSSIESAQKDLVGLNSDLEKANKLENNLLNPDSTSKSIIDFNPNLKYDDKIDNNIEDIARTDKIDNNIEDIARTEKINNDLTSVEKYSKVENEIDSVTATVKNLDDLRLNLIGTNKSQNDITIANEESDKSSNVISHNDIKDQLNKNIILEADQLSDEIPNIVKNNNISDIISESDKSFQQITATVKESDKSSREIEDAKVDVDKSTLNLSKTTNIDKSPQFRVLAAGEERKPTDVLITPENGTPYYIRYSNKIEQASSGENKSNQSLSMSSRGNDKLGGNPGNWQEQLKNIAANNPTNIGTNNFSLLGFNGEFTDNFSIIGNALAMFSLTTVDIYRATVDVTRSINTEINAFNIGTALSVIEAVRSTLERGGSFSGTQLDSLISRVSSMKIAKESPSISTPSKSIDKFKDRTVRVSGLPSCTGFLKIYKRKGPSFDGASNEAVKIPFQFEPEISGDSKSADYNQISTLASSQPVQIYKRSTERNVTLNLNYIVTGPAMDGTKPAVDTGVTSESSKGMELWDEEYIYTYIIRNLRNLTLPNIVSKDYALAPPIVQVWYGGIDGNSASSTGLVDDPDNSRGNEIHPTFRTNWFAYDEKGSATQKSYRSLWLCKQVSFEYKGGIINNNTRNPLWVVATLQLTEIGPSVTSNELFTWRTLNK